MKTKEHNFIGSKKLGRAGPKLTGEKEK